MIGAPPAQDEQARLSGARGDFVASLPRRLEVLRAALRAVDDQPRDAGRINGLLRRLHALGSAARVLGFASVAEALGEAEKTLRRVARSGPAPTDLADVARALDLLPSLVLGAKVSIRAVVPQEAVVAATPDFPLSVLVFGPQTLADLLMQQGDLRVECERTEDPGKARELSRVFGPDVAVIDADRQGARELVELFVKDPLVEPIPIVVVGDFASSELSTTFIGLGATRVLPKPVSPDVLRRTVRELRDHGNPQVHAREALGDITVSQLVDRISIEIRRGLVEAVEPAARSSSVGFGEGTDVMSAVWGTVARLRELVTLRSDGNVRFEQTGPEGAVPLAPWNDSRRLGERGGREGRAGEGVSLQGRRVVIADDDPAVVWFLAGILKTVGAEVFEAHDGERAFELTASLWPDLVVSDVLMPKLDGFSLCHEIKRDVAVRDVPVILLSWKEDLLQRVRELGGDADGYLRKEAAASTVVERLREVLRPRARVEQRVASGGEVRGRLDGLTPRLILELACRAQRDVRVSIRDSSYLYEVQVRSGAPRTAIRSANDGSFERGEGVLSMLLGVSAGRFVVEPDDSPCRAELSGSLHEQLAGPVARARAAQRALSAGALASVTRVAFDSARVGGYLECTPEPAQSLLRDLITGASPRELLTSGRAPARLLEAVLSDFARRGGILIVETAGGIEDISQTRVPPSVEPAVARLSIPQTQAQPELQASPEPEPAPAAAAVAAPSEESEAAPPVSQRKPPAVYSQPPDSELESADAGWFTFQIDSNKPPEVAEAAVAAAPAAEAAPVPRAEDPLRRTLTSSAPPPGLVDALPGSSVPVERGHRPEFRTATLGSAGNEAAAAQAAVAAEAALVVEPTPVATIEPAKSPPRPAVKAPRPLTPASPVVIEEDPLEHALAADTPAPLGVAQVHEMLGENETESVHSVPVPSAVTNALMPWAGPAKKQAAEESADQAGPAPTPATFGQTLPLSAMAAGTTTTKSPVMGKPQEPRRSDVSTQPPQAAPRPVSSKAPVKAAAKAPAPAQAEASGGGGWLRTAIFAAIAAGGSYYLVTFASSFWSAPKEPGPAPSAETAPTPVPAPVVSAALAPDKKLQFATMEADLPPGVDVPAGNGMLEIQVPDGTAIRVDGEYLGMGPSRRVPLKAGAHELALGEAPPLSITITAGQRLMASLIATNTTPVGRP